MLKVNNNPYNTQKTSYGPNFKGITVGPKLGKALDKLGNIKSPGQRLIFGVSALAIHPVMDKMNPWIDEDTKETSAIRSAAKAIACTVTGVIIREGCIVGTNALLNNKNISSKFPKYMLKDKNHTAAVIGTLMGLGVMMFTNFIIDVPLCDKLTTIFTKMRAKKNQTPEKKPEEIKTPKPDFQKNEHENLHKIEDKIKKGELPPMSQINMEVIKWA